MTLRQDMQRRVQASQFNPNVQAAFEQCIFLMETAADAGESSCPMDLRSRHLSESEFDMLVDSLKGPKFDIDVVRLEDSYMLQWD